MAICLEQGADLHMAQLMPLPSLASVKSRLVFTFLVSADPVSHGQRAIKWVYVVVVVAVFIVVLVVIITMGENLSQLVASDFLSAAVSKENFWKYDLCRFCISCAIPFATCVKALKQTK